MISFSSTTEKFNPQGIMNISISKEGKGNRYICRWQYMETDKKASLDLKGTYREKNQDRVNTLSLLSGIRQLHRLKKEKVVINIPSSNIIAKIESDFGRGGSHDEDLEEIIKLLREFRFFKLKATEG